MDSSNSEQMRPGRWLTIGILLLILAAGFVLRTWHVDWADGQLPHPDERSTIAFYAPTIRWPDEGISPLDKRQSPLNPLWDIGRQSRRSYTYGHFPLYLLVLAAEVAHDLAPVAQKLGASPELVVRLQAANGVPGYAIVGRVIMAIADTFTVLLVYLLAVRIYGRRRGRKWVGLLAAAFSAFSVIQIQLSHFFAVDPISTTFTLLALYGALRMTDPSRSSGRTGTRRRQVLWAVVTGAGAGLAIASKFSALPILAAPVIAGVILWWQGRDGEPDDQQEAEAQEHSDRFGDAQTSRLASQPGVSQIAGLVLLALFVAVLIFAITSPFAILDWENFSKAVLEEQGAMVRGDTDFPFTRQYRGTLPYVYHIEQQIRWGLGLPLGILAFAGLAWALLKALRGRALPGEWIILSWIVPYFGLTGLFLAKFMRYMVPVTPLLLVFAAGLVTAIATRKRSSQPRLAQSPVLSKANVEAEQLAADYASRLPDAAPRKTSYRLRNWLALLIAGVTLLGAISWSLAYVDGVYNDTHPWIKVSRWIYAREGVPDGSTIAWEQWDDSLPYDLPEPNSNRGRYRFIDWGPFEEDTEQKFQILKDTLRRADVIVLSSNRIYGAVDNLPERYPMTNRYYELLFNGELGYELALKETNHPNLFGIEINDEKADESFTLYDHPTVLVFRKVRDLSDAEWEQLLGGSWIGAEPWEVGEPTLLSRAWAVFRDRQPQARPEPGPGEGPDLLLDQPLAEQPVVQDFRWNTLASRSVPLAVLTWWLALTLLGLLAWPLAFVLLDNLRDRGYLLARSLGWLVTGYIVWLAASLRLGQNALWMIGVALALLAGFSLLLFLRNRWEMLGFWRAHRRLLLFGEGLFAAAYLFFVLLRIANPDLWQPWQGGEKFMEFAFLNAILRSAHFPPIDPYFAGGTINYYYYGQYLVALLAKLTGIWSSVAFNLAIPTLFALTAVNVFSLGYTLAARFRVAAAGDADAGGIRRWRRRRPRWLWHGVSGGLLAAFFVALLGNVDGGGQVVRALADRATRSIQSDLPGLETALRAASGFANAVAGPATLPGYRYWDPSRVIPFTINEFPYWSFLFADLHPHMIGIPFTVLFLALAYNLLARYGQGSLRYGTAAPGLLRRLVGWVRRLTGDGLYLAMALVLGALAVINTWDLPTYFGLAVLAWLVRELRRLPQPSQLGRSDPQRSRAIWLALLRSGLFAAGLLALSLGLYLPFFRHYTALASSGLGLVDAKTEAGKWLNIWGFFLLIAVTFLLVELRLPPFGRNVPGRPAYRRFLDPGPLRWLNAAARRWSDLGRLVQLTPRLSGAMLVALLLLLALAAGLWLLGQQVIALLFLPLALAAGLLLRRSTTAETTFLVMLIFTGLLVLAGVELFYLRDHLQGGDFRRMNTLFKFYIQVWVMLGLAGGAALPRIWRFMQEHWKAGWQLAWMAGFAYLLALSLVFPLVGTPARLEDRFPVENGRPPVGTLDGMAFMEYGAYTWHPDPNLAPSTRIELRYDYDAIKWLLDNVEGTPLVAEALVGYYREGGLRVASFTGFPTFLGFHQEGEQRYGWQTGLRRSLAEEFWNTTDPTRTREIIDELDVQYIYIGQLEQIMTSPEGLAKFERMAEAGELEEVYRNERVVIYRVVTG